MRTYDVVIVGGAVHGASVAYHLGSSGFGGSVLLIEKDATFARAATALSAGSIRQQFSSAINIAISLYGIAFLRAIGETLAVDGDRPDVGLHEGGYLFLATDNGAATLAANHRLQAEMGADILHLDRDGLASHFPYLATDDIDAGCWGRSGEGWFDGYRLMQALRTKARALGVTLETAEVATLGDGVVHLAGGETIGAGAIVVAAGTATPRLLTPLGVALPVEARKRMVFAFDCRTPLPRFPLLVDPSGVYVRPEGDIYICGTSPPADSDPPATDFEVEHGFFEEMIWPVLAARVPAFEEIKLGRAWAGHYDFNMLDQNAIVGRVPAPGNVFVATGFSGHGLQQAPAVGRGIAELIVSGRYTTLDMSPLGYERIAENRPLIEANVV